MKYKCPHCNEEYSATFASESQGSLALCQCKEAFKEYEAQQRALFEARKRKMRNAQPRR